ncbi:hypothetical protein D5018_11040 [Parashewanella curva]|uniref:Uncharacterized protein n=1 Tax=Parashewanella curva TaxID=2338552 RepID=A0A3L8PWI8_9GAMM|nr:hypothetical protein [Parashewanella curva]RLV59680.1 hypothetical protein D5018_11040 [Parashewanella curva]
MVEDAGKISIVFCDVEQRVTRCNFFNIQDRDFQELRIKLNTGRKKNAYLYRRKTKLHTPPQENLYTSLSKFLNESTISDIKEKRRDRVFTVTEHPIDSRKSKLRSLFCI